MTRRFNPLPLLALSLSVFITASCIDIDKTAGDGFVPSDQLLGVSVKEFDLPVQMKKSDSLQSMYTGAIIVGAYKDDLFGLTTSGGAFRIIPQKDSNDFGNAPAANYFRMSIQFADNIVLNENESSIPQNIFIYKLREDLDTLKFYNNSLDASAFDPAPLNPGGTVYFGGDTLSIDLSVDYANYLLTANAEERDSLEIFFKKFKGLYIATEPLPGSQMGGRFNIIKPEDIYMTLSYHHVDDSIDKQDSLLLYYVSASEPNINLFSHSSGALATTQPTEKLYVEGIAGIKPFIDMSQLRGNMAQWATANNFPLERVVIAKAELIFPYEFPSNYVTMGQFPTQLFIATRTTGESYDGLYYELLPEISHLDGNGNINRSQSAYNLNITSYLQKVLGNKFTKRRDLEAYIMPVMSTSNSQTGEVSYFVDNSVYYKGILNGMNSVRKPKLRIAYTVIP